VGKAIQSIIKVGMSWFRHWRFSWGFGEKWHTFVSKPQ